MLPTSPRRPLRSTCTSCSMPFSTTPTRASRGVTLIRISSVMGTPAGSQTLLISGRLCTCRCTKPDRSGPVGPGTHLAQQAHGLEQRQAHHPGVAAGQVSDESGRASLDRIRAGLAERLAGGDVAVDVRV